MIIMSDRLPLGLKTQCARSGTAAGGREHVYISGSFCVSITAAMGMPKLETGPQKSVEVEIYAVSW